MKQEWKRNSPPTEFAADLGYMSIFHRNSIVASMVSSPPHYILRDGKWKCHYFAKPQCPHQFHSFSSRSIWSIRSEMRTWCWSHHSLGQDTYGKELDLKRSVLFRKETLRKCFCFLKFIFPKYSLRKKLQNRIDSHLLSRKLFFKSRILRITLHVH